MMEISDRIVHLQHLIQARIPEPCLSNFPIKNYLNFFNRNDTMGLYTNFPGELNSWFGHIRSEAGTEILCDIHRLASLTLMSRSLSELENRNLSRPIFESVLIWYNNFCDRIELDDNTHFDANDDFFKKDISIAALRLWPTTSICHFEPISLPRSFILSGGVKQFVAGLWTLLFELGGNRQFYSLHIDDRRINPHFLENGWIEFYKIIAEEVLVQPHIAGLFASSWFWDSKVGQNCKHMRYLRRIPEEGGARFFYDCPDPDRENANALRNKKLKRLYNEGKYIPTNYILIWPRKALLKWAGP